MSLAPRLLRSAHPLSRSLPSPARLQPSTTPFARRGYASEPSSAPGSGPNIDAMKEQFRASPMFEKISRSEGAMGAVREMGELMQKKGISITEKPSMMTMAKLAMDSEVRAVTQKMMTEFQKAGIDLNQESLAQMFMGGGGKK